MNRISSILLRAALPAALLTACTTTVTDDIEAGEESVSRAINFGTPALSRSAIDNANNAAFNAFKVWGWSAPAEGGASAVEFDGETVSRNSNLWTYEGYRYWQEGRTYNFYALYPSKLNDNAYYNSGGTLQITNYAPNKREDNDLMVAYASRDYDGTDNSAVAFTFKHLLARVKISVKAVGVTATVTNASLSGVNTTGSFSATIDDNLDADAIQDRWRSNDNTVPAAEYSGSIAIPAYETVVLDALLIPQGSKGTLSIIYDRGNGEETDVITLPTTPAAWQAGSVYNYILTIESNAITFSNFTVDEWGESHTGGDINIGSSTN